MQKSNLLTPEERAKITAIQDELIDRYVEQNEALKRGDKAQAITLEFEIKMLKRELEEIKEWASV
jgi:hypothetical protein